MADDNQEGAVGVIEGVTAEGAVENEQAKLAEAHRRATTALQEAEGRAIDQTNDYMNSRYQGERGVTWVISGFGLGASIVPILDRVLRNLNKGGRIELLPYRTRMGDQLYAYAIERVADGFSIEKQGRGFAAGDLYIFTDDGKIFKAGTKDSGWHTEYLPGGGHRESPGKVYIDRSKLFEVTKMEPELEDMLVMVEQIVREGNEPVTASSEAEPQPAAASDSDNS